jgi:tetratricopeptide (TPR) repeat protein
MRRPKRHLARTALLVVATVLLLVLSGGCHAWSPKTRTDAVTLMANYGKQGKYDDAIRVAHEWLKSHPEDASWDGGTFYDQMGLIYLVRASKDPARKDEWIKQAIASFDKNLSINQPKDIGVELFVVGRGFEEAGDLSTTDSCLYYEQAIKAFAELEPAIQGDTYNASGTAIPLEPLRRDTERVRERVRTKLTKAGCK